MRELPENNHERFSLWSSLLPTPLGGPCIGEVRTFLINNIKFKDN